MALVWLPSKPITPIINPNNNFIHNFPIRHKAQRSVTLHRSTYIKESSRRYLPLYIVNEQQGNESNESTSQGNYDEDLGVKVALSMLRFYKNEISPLLPKSCRYVPTCSEYSMIAYKKYGVVKGSILTAWRICRCNPLGGSGFDPPRWFDEPSPPEQ